MSTLELWESVERTDPSQVKPITGKQYQGTSPKPYYLIKKATETFGPCGICWGFTIDERIENGALIADGVYERMHIAKVKVWYEWQGKRGEVEHIGGTPFSGVRNNGKPFTDEDAPKKSVTDALIKALSMIGFAGDIFMGRFDDSKYVNELKEEERERNRKPHYEEAADAYTAVAKTAMLCAETTIELRKWWDSEAKERERVGVVKGTPAYADLFSAFLAYGKELAGKVAA